MAVLKFLLLFGLSAIVSADTQQPWSTRDGTFIVKEWEAIGPFPSGMREHPFLSSPSPYASLNRSSSTTLDRQFLTLPFNSTQFPSYLGPHGQAIWSKLEGNHRGHVEVGYKTIDWSSLRRDKGWEGVQFEVLLRGNITTPNSLSNSGERETINVEVQLLQGLEFSIHPLDSNPDYDLSNPDLTRWMSGNIYSLSSPTASADDDDEWYLPQRVILLPGTTYTILLRTLYEVRLFGDPGPDGPVIKVDFKMRVEPDSGSRGALTRDSAGLGRVEGLDLVGDVLDGWVLGDEVGVGLRGMKTGSNMVVMDVKVTSPDSGISVRLASPSFRLVDKQTRLLGLKVDQTGALSPPLTTFELVMTYSDEDINSTLELSIYLDLTHQTWSNRTSTTAWRYTHPYPSSTLAYGILLPPTSPDPYDVSLSNITFLALHGAGVHASSSAWTDELPRLSRGWGVAVTGGNQWGMDWHGVSMEGSRMGLREARKVVGLLRQRMGWEVEGWGMADETVVMGHSNGGQGANHLVSHYPDEFVGLIQAAGYLKIQDYVSYNSWTSRHFADPALISILGAALTPYDNPLYASNLVGIAVLAIHGTDDDNVPVWHSRAMRGIMQEWAGSSALFDLDEVADQGHFWPGIMKRKSVLDFLARAKARKQDPLVTGFTLTTANPMESGSKGGVRILELEWPGRVGRVTVSHVFPLRTSNDVILDTSNVKRLSLEKNLIHDTPPVLDNQAVWNGSGNETMYFEKRLGRWSIASPDRKASVRHTGPMFRILSSCGPILLVYGTSKNRRQYKMMASALAYDIHLYQNLDVEVVDDIAALDLARNEKLQDRNIISFGHPHDNGFISWLLEGNSLEVSAPSSSSFQLHETVIDAPGTGLIAVLAHPNFDGSLVCMIAGTDMLGSDLAARIFAVRTGVLVPDWLIVDTSARFRGAGGVVGAGFWNNDWKWSEAMSYVS